MHRWAEVVSEEFIVQEVSEVDKCKIEPISSELFGKVLNLKWILLNWFDCSTFRAKVSELESEIQRLQKETDSFTEDNKQYFALSKAFVSNRVLFLIQFDLF